MRIRLFREEDRAAVIDLWRRCDLTRPWNDPDLDIDRKVARDPDGFLVLEDDVGTLVGCAMFGYDGHRGSVNYLGVDPDRRGGGHARLLMAEIEQRLQSVGCPKINLMVRTGNVDVVAFYERLGYGTEDVVTMGNRLIEDASRP
ncbi:MAG: putative N-acetyltransferase [Acidimicrobiales bacterium]|nr:MAG: putative N-acetyltransferase [Acidimicrobiales bacterium]